MPRSLCAQIERQVGRRIDAARESGARQDDPRKVFNGTRRGADFKDAPHHNGGSRERVVDEVVELQLAEDDQVVDREAWNVQHDALASCDVHARSMLYALAPHWSARIQHWTTPAASRAG